MSNQSITVSPPGEKALSDIRQSKNTCVRRLGRKEIAALHSKLGSLKLEGVELAGRDAAGLKKAFTKCLERTSKEKSGEFIEVFVDKIWDSAKIFGTEAPIAIFHLSGRKKLESESRDFGGNFDWNYVWREFDSCAHDFVFNNARVLGSKLVDVFGFTKTEANGSFQFERKFHFGEGGEAVYSRHPRPCVAAANKNRGRNPEKRGCPCRAGIRPRKNREGGGFHAQEKGAGDACACHKRFLPRLERAAQPGPPLAAARRWAVYETFINSCFNIKPLFLQALERGSKIRQHVVLSIKL